MATSPRLVAGHRDALRSAESLFETKSIAQIREVSYADCFSRALLDCHAQLHFHAVSGRWRPRLEMILKTRNNSFVSLWEAATGTGVPALKFCRLPVSTCKHVRNPTNSCRDLIDSADTILAMTTCCQAAVSQVNGIQVALHPFTVTLVT